MKVMPVAGKIRAEFVRVLGMEAIRKAETRHGCTFYLNVARQVLLFQAEYSDLQLKIERSGNFSIAFGVVFY
jgi:hypothetical protein